MPNSGKLISLHSNDVVFLAWQFEKAIPNCLGFTVRRKDLGEAAPQFKALPAWVGWEGGSNDNWVAKNTDIWPVQKFSWRDFTAEPGHTYQYEVIPMTGTPDSLESEDEMTLISGAVTLTPVTANGVEAYFNNGILSTQHVSHMIPTGSTGAPNYQKLLTHIQTKGDTLRGQLAGQMIDAVLSLLGKAQAEGGECYAALYELNDDELISELLKTGNRLHLILSTAGTNDSTNKDARAKLHAAGIDITDRMLGSAHIGHNKFVVYVDASGKARKVLAGSTNWTSTGLCAQSNNSVIVTDDTIADWYKKYWERIKADTVAANGVAKDLQAAGYRQANDHAHVSGKTTVWYSPNTVGKSKPANATLTNGTPGDLQDVFAAIRGAEQAVLFLEFEPGTPSVLDVIKEMEQQNANLFIRGAATDPNAIEKFDEKNPITTALYHRSTSGEPDTVFETGVAATAINDEFAYWKKELLKSSPKAHAIIHDKIVVIDPMSPSDCVVVMGSHNQGYKASYANDENLVIFRGNQALALAYATHVMDVYDHYRWRYIVQQHGTHAWTGLKKTPQWQDKYFQPGNTAYQEQSFWMTAPAVVAAPLAAPVGPGAPALPAVPPVIGPLRVPVHAGPMAHHKGTTKRRTPARRVR